MAAAQAASPASSMLGDRGNRKYATPGSSQADKDALAPCQPSPALRVSMGTALTRRCPPWGTDLVRKRCRSGFGRRRDQMSRGLPSLTALLGLVALAGYQNRDKLAEMLQGATGSGSPGGNRQQGPLG